MKIIGVGLLHAFSDGHADCRKWIACWIKEVRTSHWKNTHDIKSRYPSSSFLANNMVIFNVRGNNYRLETQIALKSGVVSVRWIGTHEKYSRRTK